MKTTPVTPADLAASVIAVPPLARHRDLTISNADNRALIQYLEDGGVRTLLYGGNANLYNVGASELPELLDMLEEEAGEDSWVIPSVGPDYGKLMDQLSVLKGRAFPTVMILPLAFPATGDGVATGIRRFAERFGKPVIVYIKADGYLEPPQVAALVNDGLVAGIKYATVRTDPGQDIYLRALLDVVDRQLIVSGIGERPAIIHLRDFGLQGFTSGSVCVAPNSSMRILALCKDGQWDAAEEERIQFLPLENLRDAHSPIRVLHEAVTLAGIADMGPMLPMLSNLAEAHRVPVREAALALRQHDEQLAPS
ncbi:MAG TPA: dihydrodipicolinate synthase family protein [Gemmatimonadaceae bacterium]|nr:dihydrodipicolinate synthase family protein [Gemmatimonadaceae bacterium]